MRILALMLLMTIVTGCSTETLPESAQSTTDTKAAETSDSSEVTDGDAAEPEPESDSGEFVIDVRSKEEWDTGHVENAAHIPHTEIVDRIAEVTDNKTAKIVVYCAAGGRAGKAKQALEDLGFTNVENAGGYDDIKDRY